MFQGVHTKVYVEQVYLHNSREFEKTLDMFFSGVGLPTPADLTRLTIQVEDATTGEM